MYEIAYSYNYILDVLILFVINALIVFRLAQTEGFGKNEHWLLALLLSGELYNIFDLLCILLQGKVPGTVFFLINALYYICYSVTMYILLRYTKKVCTETQYFNSIFNRCITVVPLVFSVAMIILSYWTGWVFGLDEQGVYYRGAYYYHFYALELVFVLYIIAISLWHLVKKEQNDSIVIHPIFFSLPILVGAVLQWVLPTYPGNNMGLTASFLLIFINYHEAMVMKSLEKKNVVLEEAYHKLEEQYDIVDALSVSHHFVYYMNVKTGRYRTIKSSNDFEQILPADGYAPEVLSFYVEKYVAGLYQSQMLEFTDVHTLEERLKNVGTISCEYQREDNQWRRVNWTVASRDMDGKVENVLFSIVDITKEMQDRDDMRLKLEQALRDADQAAKAKSEFLHNMSHDIRTPMNAILGYAHLMKDEIDHPEKVREYLDKQEQAGGFLLTLINRILDMSKIESGKEFLDENIIHIGEVSGKVIEVYSEMAREKNIELKHYHDVQHGQVFGDKTKLSEIFNNLISNALKYTKEGGTVTVSISEIPGDQEGYANIQTIVEDTGIGMNQEFLPYLFDEFTRESGLASEMASGTGLGMPFVKKLVELMNGTIEVESKPGEGTRFTMVIPHKIVEHSSYKVSGKEKKTASMDEIDVSVFAGKRILLAEDNSLNVEIATAILNGLGFTVDRAKDGMDCVERYKQAQAGTYDLILMDIQMPRMNGYEATTSIRNLADTKKANIPIVAMTADAFEEDRKKAAEVGMNGHLAKPIDIGRLMATLFSLLRQDSRQDENLNQDKEDSRQDENLDQNKEVSLSTMGEM